MEQSDDKKHPHDDWHMYATKLSKVTNIISNVRLAVTYTRKNNKEKV